MRLELTRSSDYALRAMLALTRQPDETLSSTEIAALTHIPVRFVTQVMAHLVHAGLVRAVIGRSGGYRLVLPAAKVTVLAVVEAVEGDTRRQHCAIRGGQCLRGAPCEVHAVFADAQEAFVSRLAATSLAAVVSSEAGTVAGQETETTVRNDRPLAALQPALEG
jgi:Rrf2 family nitric oxide-sensitive transcriptional repressor